MESEHPLYDGEFHFGPGWRGHSTEISPYILTEWFFHESGHASNSAMDDTCLQATRPWESIEPIPDLIE